MRVSLNEVSRICQKAVEGAGLPAGIDGDAAASVQWLEARGLPGLALLVADLDDHLSRGRPLSIDPSAGERLDADGRSGLFLGALLMELAAARAAGTPEGVVDLRVERLRSPCGLLAPAQSLLAGERGCRLAWAGGATAPATRAILSPSSVILHAQEPTLCQPGEAYRVHIQLGPRDRLSAGDGEPPLDSASPAALDRRAADVLANGVEVDAAAWRRLGDYASRVLVPASAESRLLGAGSAALDDNQ